MRTLLLGSAITLALAAPAVAADMPVYRKAPVAVAAPYSWSGFYIGGNAGYSWGHADTSQTDISSTTSTTLCFRDLATLVPIGGSTTGAVCGLAGQTFPQVATTTGGAGTIGSANVNGFIGGGQIGYNSQFDRQWLAGLEADLQYSGERGDQNGCSLAGCPAGSAFGSSSEALKWFGTVRGRLGWLPSERVLLYATGGLAYGRIDSSYVSGVSGVSLLAAGSSTTRAGWTVGAGIEGAITDRWTLKAEYLYADYGSFGTGLGTGANVTTVTNTLITAAGGTQTTAVTNVSAAVNTHFTDSILRAGLNYRLAP